MNQDKGMNYDQTVEMATSGFMLGIGIYILGFALETLSCACATLSCSDTEALIPFLWSWPAFITIMLVCTGGGALIGFMMDNSRNAEIKRRLLAQEQEYERRRSIEQQQLYMKQLRNEIAQAKPKLTNNKNAISNSRTGISFKSLETQKTATQTLNKLRASNLNLLVLQEELDKYDKQRKYSNI